MVAYISDHYTRDINEPLIAAAQLSELFVIRHESGDTWKRTRVSLSTGIPRLNSTLRIIPFHFVADADSGPRDTGEIAGLRLISFHQKSATHGV